MVDKFLLGRFNVHLAARCARGDTEVLVDLDNGTVSDSKELVIE